MRAVLSESPSDLSVTIGHVPMTVDLSSRVALVTGGGKGVGRGITSALLEAGAHVVVVSRTKPYELPSNTSFHSADVRDAEAVQSAVQHIVEEHGRLDIVVNNAGGSPPSDAATASPRFAEKIVALNLLAPLYVAQAANAVMQEQDDGGSIVNIGSVSGMRPSPGTAVYGAAKAGLAGLTRTLAMEWAPKVRVNLVVVGMVRTEQSELFYGDEEGVRAVGATVPLGRLAEPTDVGAMCAFLASPAASYVSGAEILLHGGGERPPYLAASNADIADTITDRGRA
jgi:NAD(P)-dependent dehydrogenase (short-subunit alcohol dehydrogenase family)